MDYVRVHQRRMCTMLYCGCVFVYAETNSHYIDLLDAWHYSQANRHRTAFTIALRKECLMWHCDHVLYVCIYMQPHAGCLRRPNPAQSHCAP